MRTARTTLVLTAATATLASMTAVGAVLAYDGGAGLYGCTRGDVDFGRRLTDDPALAALAGRLDPGAEPDWSCDQDDSSVAASLELVTGLERDAALPAGGAVLEEAGWVRSERRAWCFEKRIGGRRVSATLTYDDEFRSDPRTDLGITLHRHGRC
ncbi:hypothetical protein GUY44_05095 [Pimelobacter simplex]|uniref:Uncharacterized protein n=1 Tax=Nocardioides simplex TaxID=2045 RepID=A0A0A1DJG8_NOCSI|nr:hypothetical protein [Pimelobacter simplex]AIY17479.1 hypothetical protein KR76_13235 [Pimelobacter simplex]MCG8149846.1 hypothetical protein [Pimelobacter simplex]GEB13945.1 hypothetical protein NSI01_22600 [Pimelobacter simplex]SFM66075.1 hypothetical protein SAMN05421671_2727 [Pimelobacter simplex]